MAKIFGGSASRLEVYALFAAAVVLIGGGVAGAVVVTSSGSKPAEVAQVTVDTTVVDTSISPTTAPPTAEGTTPPTTAAQRYYNPEPQAPVTSYPNQPVQTVAPQPVQDYSAHCTMPNLVGLTGWPALHNTVESVEPAMRAAGCLISATPQWCLDATLIPRASQLSGISRVRSQSPQPGTLLHRTLGTFSYSAGYYPEVQPNNPSWVPYFNHGMNAC